MTAKPTSYHVQLVYDVSRTDMLERIVHERYLNEWDVVNQDGIYQAGPFYIEADAAAEAERLTRLAAPGPTPTPQRGGLDPSA